MAIKRRICSVIFVFSLLLTTSCARTTLDSVWVDPHYQGGKFKKVLVVGVARKQTTRRLFEDKFAEKIKTYGTDAISSYTIIPSAEKLNKVTIESNIKTLQIDAILVTKLVNVRQNRNYSTVINPSRRPSGSGGTYSTDYKFVEQGTYYEYQTVSLETNIYDTQTDKLIWSGWSDTILEDSVEVAIESLIKAITKSLSDKQLI